MASKTMTGMGFTWGSNYKFENSPMSNGKPLSNGRWPFISLELIKGHLRSTFVVNWETSCLGLGLTTALVPRPCHTFVW